MLELIAGLISLGGAIALTVLMLGTRPAAVAAGDSDRPGGVGGSDGPSRAVGLAGRRLVTVSTGAGTAIGTRLSRRGYPARAQRLLDLAGAPRGWTVQRLIAARGMAVVGGAALGLLIGLGDRTLLLFVFTASGAAVGAVLPDLLLRRRGEQRQAELRRELPHSMDMLTVCVEAGMAFDAALGRVARSVTGPVSDEFSRLLQEMQFGTSRTDALRALVARTDVPELRSFVAAMVQATEVGISIGDVLREQSRQMRVARRQRAEERAQRMQVKLLLPLITCLLPAMFVVILGPAVIELADFFNANK